MVGWLGPDNASDQSDFLDAAVEKPSALQTRPVRPTPPESTSTTMHPVLSIIVTLEMTAVNTSGNSGCKSVVGYSNKLNLRSECHLSSHS